MAREHLRTDDYEIMRWPRGHLRADDYGIMRVVCEHLRADDYGAMEVSCKSSASSMNINAAGTPDPHAREQRRAVNVVDAW